MGVVLGCGFSTPISPGSLLSPSIVTSFPDSLFAFPMSFGLLYEGFGCHTMIPQIINEMKKPKQFNTMVGLCFLFACILNIGFGIVGYLMFGNNTMEEISLNLIHFGDYNPYLIKSTLWLIIISFVTKFPLVLVPLNLDFEQTIFHRFPKLNNIYISIFMRTVLAFLILVVTIVAPNFDSLIGILGSIISITVCVLIPVICHLKLNGGWRVPFYRLKKLSEFKPNQDSKKADQVVQVVEFNVMGDWEILMCWMILLLGTFFAIMGTVWACIQPKLHVHTFE